MPAATTPKSGFGIKLAVSTDGVSFTSLGFVRNVSHQGYGVGAVDISNADSANQTQEFVPGIASPGSLQVDGVYAPGAAGQILLEALARAAPVTRYFRVEFTNHNWKLTTGSSSFLSSLDLSATYDDTASFSATIQISGVVTGAVIA